jgi:hypothetical protein
MAAHKKRSGALIVCFWCKNGQCSESVVHGLDEIVCHCVCQPTCTRPACQTPTRRRRNVSRLAPCVRCRLTVCDCSLF